MTDQNQTNPTDPASQVQSDPCAQYGATSGAVLVSMIDDAIALVTCIVHLMQQRQTFTGHLTHGVGMAVIHGLNLLKVEQQNRENEDAIPF